MNVVQRILSSVLLLPSMLMAISLDNFIRDMKPHLIDERGPVRDYAQCQRAYYGSKYHEANTCYLKTLSEGHLILPSHAADWGESLLAVGDFKNGFKLREQRLNFGPYTDPSNVLQKPWDGSDPRGKRIMVRCEAGFGDTFFFARYLYALKECGAYIILYTPDKLRYLMANCPCVDQIVVSKDNKPPFDYDVYMMSLPLYLAHDKSSNNILLKHTEVHTIPAVVGKQIFADCNLVNRWQFFFPKNKFNVGICWKSSTNNAAATRSIKRDIKLQELVKLGNIPGVKLYNLLTGIEKPVRHYQAERTTDEYNIIPDDAPIVQELILASDRDEGAFMNTAAVIEHLDLVISVDTSVPNLAGAMNRPVWFLLPFKSDWRWGSHQSSISDWYPTATLFWQPTQGDWESVMHRVYKELELLVKAKLG